MTGIHSKFETEMQVRPDDIDLFQHVHSSRYMDYVLAARYDQRTRCYDMPWEEFLADDDGVRVRFEIEKRETGKRCVDGHAEYKLINLAANRAVPIPKDIKARYSI
jgi:acyl-CoA thioester hydrolase/thioesterase-3